jgi:hypothetical protein
MLNNRSILLICPFNVWLTKNSRFEDSRNSDQVFRTGVKSLTSDGPLPDSFDNPRYSSCGSTIGCAPKSVVEVFWRNNMAGNQILRCWRLKHFYRAESRTLLTNIFNDGIGTSGSKSSSDASAAVPSSQMTCADVSTRPMLLGQMSLVTGH